MYSLGLGVKETMAYRADFWLGLVSAAFPITIQIFMWQALFRGAGTGELFGRGYHQMLAYSVSAAILWRLLRTGFEYDINEDIKKRGLEQVCDPASRIPAL